MVATNLRYPRETYEMSSFTDQTFLLPTAQKHSEFDGFLGPPSRPDLSSAIYENHLAGVCPPQWENDNALLLNRYQVQSETTLLCLRSSEDASLQIHRSLCDVCSRINCRLKSHRHYTSAKVYFRSGYSQDTDLNGLSTIASPLRSLLADPFLNLPGIGKAESDSHQSFRDFFTSQSRSIRTPVRIRAFDLEYQETLVRQALSDPALCLSCIAMSATYAAVHGQGLQRPDSRLLRIYGRTLRALREQIADSAENGLPDTTIMAAVNLLTCQGVGFGDEQAMSTLISLSNLVNACGGISSLQGSIAALSLWVDFDITLYTGRKPMFLDQIGLQPAVPLSDPPPIRYGNGFKSLAEKQIISSSLREVCDTTCRLTELLEDNVRGAGTESRWEYFMYRRNNVTMRNGVVHSNLFGRKTKAECISHTNNLLVFLVLRLMPWNMPLVNLSNLLRTALQASVLSDWEANMDVLLWILFVLLSFQPWEGRDWALQVLLDTLTHHYACKKANWPPNWREMQRQNLMKYAWSEIYLSKSFETTCRDLGKLDRSVLFQS